jgi:uncharacterized protein (DUF2267 family)
MTTNVFAGLETTLVKTRGWVQEVTDELERQDPQDGYHALRAALHTLRDHLPVEEVAHLGAQLPVLLRGIYYEGWRPGALQDRDLDLDGVRRELGPGRELDPELSLRAAFAVIARHVSAGEMSDVTGALPRRLRTLFD